MIKPTISQLYADALAQGESAPPILDALASGSLDALLAVLDNSSLDPQIHAEACWMLGQQGDERALPALRHIAATDTATLPGWWSVQREAADAIAHIQWRARNV